MLCVVLYIIAMDDFSSYFIMFYGRVTANGPTALVSVLVFVLVLSVLRHGMSDQHRVEQAG